MSGGLATQGYTQKHLVSIISAAMCLKAFPYLGFKGISVGIGVSKGMGMGMGMGLGLGKSLGSSTVPLALII